MDWLNYHHLYYFWLVAREGSIARASRQLHLARPTVSKQLRQLEGAFGGELFERIGRRLVLTEFGQSVFHYADEIFSTGRELQALAEGRPSHRPLRLAVGLTDVLPKLVAARLLRPAFGLPEQVHAICLEGRQEELLAQLAVHRLDIVLSDAPASPTVNVRAFNHLLGQSGVSLFAQPALALKHRRRFPESLEGAPFLAPTEKTAVRRELEKWFHTRGIRPRIRGEFEDTALMMAFGQDGVGIFPAPTIIEREVCRQYVVRLVGRIDEVLEQYFAISVQRRITHPAVIAICDAARGGQLSLNAAETTS